MRLLAPVFSYSRILVFFALLILLWLPGLHLPITSDTTIYTLLGENIWKHASYMIDGSTNIKYLPLHAFFSYPFVFLFGDNTGMKVATLCAGWGVFAAAFLLLKKSFSAAIAWLAVLFLLFHHGFLLITMLGSADLLFTALFLGSLAAFASAGQRPRLYLLSGLLLGLASLTRYNGIPLFLFYPLYIWVARPTQRFSKVFWAGWMIAAGCIGLWLLRNALVFGNPLHTGYGAEYSAEVPSVFSLLIRNIWFYGNPLHNVLPILLILGFWGILREWRRQGLLLGGMIAGMALAMVWWVQGMRFVLPGIVIFLGFAAAGTVDLWQRWKSLRLLLILVAIATVVLQGSALCLYTYGQCNAWFDRTIGVIPADLHISSEGLYGIALARDYIDKTAPKGAAVLVQSINQQTWERGVFRSDLHIVPTIDEACTLTDHVYEIVQGENVANPIFTTASSPKTSVVLRSCK